MKYQVIETRKFVAGNLEGLVFHCDTWNYDNYHDACKEANNRKNASGKGYGFDSPYIVIDTKVIER
jgi:hypothetical protein